MQIRDRIKELRRVKASELCPNPRNWRTHPQAQQDALRGVLAEIGYADALLAREREDGSLMLVDGHLRAETTPDQMVPVLILDIDEAEAAKLLLTLDPLAEMAEANKDALGELLAGTTTESAALQDMLASLASQHGIDVFQSGAEDEPYGGDGDGESRLGSPVLSFNLVFDDDDQQQAWFRFLRWLRDRFPETETHGARLAAYLAEVGV